MRNYVTFRTRDSHPLSLLNEIERDMGRAFKTIATPPEFSHDFAPACDVTEKESHFLLSFDLPGIPKNDIQIEVNDGQLHISGERKREQSESDYSEKRYGSFKRTLTLPQDVEEDKIEAHYEHGVLSIALPKAEKAAPQKITIGDDKKHGIWSKLLGADTKEFDEKESDA